MSRVLVFAGGTPPTLNRFVRSSEDRVIAADSGALHALRQGFVPELVIGDFDSLPGEALSEIEQRGIPLERHPRAKDETDLELAMIRAAQWSPREIVLLSAVGGTLDHLLGNLLLLNHPALSGIPLTLIDSDMLVVPLRGPEERTIATAEGDIVSLISLSAVCRGASLSNVRWPLIDAEIPFGAARTIRNEARGESVRCSLKEGLALVIHLGNARVAPLGASSQVVTGGED